MVWCQPWAETQNPIWKITKQKGCGLSGRTPAYQCEALSSNSTTSTSAPFTPWKKPWKESLENCHHKKYSPARWFPKPDRLLKLAECYFNLQWNHEKGYIWDVP
jgi:hypothetical protein